MLGDEVLRVSRSLDVAARKHNRDGEYFLYEERELSLAWVSCKVEP